MPVVPPQVSGYLRKNIDQQPAGFELPQDVFRSFNLYIGALTIHLPNGINRGIAARKRMLRSVS